MRDTDCHYRDGEADTSKVYLILEPNGDLIARVTLPNTYTDREVTTQMNAMARALGGQWWDGEN